MTPLEALLEVLEECVQEARAKGSNTCTFRVSDLLGTIEIIKTKEEIRLLKEGMK